MQPTRYRARLTRERFPDVLHSRVPEEVADRRGLVLQLGHRAFHAVLDAFVIGEGILAKDPLAVGPDVVVGVGVRGVGWEVVEVGTVLGLADDGEG